MRTTKTATARTSAARSLVVNRLEGVSKDVFKQHFAHITELIGDSPGIYALYDGAELYYVGKSIELRKRVRQHLSDRHYALWTHFSLYLVRREDHIHEIESLLVRIARPAGNRVVPSGKSSGALVKKLKQMIKRRQREELDGLFAPAGKRTRVSTRVPAASSLAGLVAGNTKLFRTYKGKNFNAMLSPTGIITYAGNKYTSASSAAKAVMPKRSAVNGWDFWYARMPGGDWARLSDLRAQTGH